jgi:uncharacterized protein YidB (DUF937 family)
MSLFDNLASAALGQLGGANGLMGMVAKNPQMMQVAASLMANDGAAGGVQGIIAKFQQAGQGTAVQSWIGTGENHAISPDHVTSALGGDMIADLAAKAGLSGGDMSGLLAQVLPMLVDKLTPDGQVSSHTGSDQIMNVLGGLFKG